MRIRAPLVGIALVVLTGCASAPPPLIVSGETLKVVGTEFVATSAAFTKGCVDKVLTVATCDGFRAFSRKFKLAFRPAVTLQQAAMESGDKPMIERTTAIVAALVSELSSFTALLGGK